MCFTCRPAMVVTETTYEMVFTRVADPYTRLDDLALTAGEQEEHEVGLAALVGLCATLMVRGRPIVTETLYGVRECPARPCAFDDVLASAWVASEALASYDRRSRTVGE